jgi:hypothetical protein
VYWFTFYLRVRCGAIVCVLWRVCVWFVIPARAFIALRLFCAKNKGVSFFAILSPCKRANHCGRVFVCNQGRACVVARLCAFCGVFAFAFGAGVCKARSKAGKAKRLKSERIGAKMKAKAGRLKSVFFNAPIPEKNAIAKTGRAF